MSVLIRVDAGPPLWPAVRQIGELASVAHSQLAAHFFVGNCGGLARCLPGSPVLQGRRILGVCFDLIHQSLCLGLRDPLRAASADRVDDGLAFLVVVRHLTSRPCSGCGISCAPGWVDEFDPDGDDAEGFAFGWVDLADVGELFLAGGQWVDRGDRFPVEHLIEVAVAGDTCDAGKDLVALAANRISDPSLMFLRLESLTRISVVLRPVAMRSKYRS